MAASSDVARMERAERHGITCSRVENKEDGVELVLRSAGSDQDRTAFLSAVVLRCNCPDMTHRRLVCKHLARGMRSLVVVQCANIYVLQKWALRFALHFSKDDATRMSLHVAAHPEVGSRVQRLRDGIRDVW